MNIKTTFFLLAVLVGVAVYFFVFEKNRTTGSGPEDGDAERPMFTADELFPDGVQMMVIDWETQSAKLVRDEYGRWMQTDPVRFPMSPVRMAGIINDAVRLQYTEKFVPGQDGKPSLASCGLDKPRVSIRFVGESRDTQIDRNTGKADTKVTPFDQTVRIGGGLTGSRGYIQINSDPHVYVVNNLLHTILLRETAGAWRQETLEVPSDSQADRIMRTVDGQTIEMQKAAGDWVFGPPVNDRVTPKAAKALLDMMRSIKVNKFVSDDPNALAGFGLDKAAVELTVFTAAIEPRTRTLRIGSAADPAGQTYHATWSLGEDASPVVFTIMRGARDSFIAPKLDDLRDPRITPLKTAGLVEVTIDAPPQKPVRLQRTATAGWSFAAPEGASAPPFKADQEAVGQLLDAITGSTAKYYRPRAAAPAVPLATIQLHGNVAGGVEKLVFFTPPADAVPKGDETPMVMVLRNNETTGYLVPTDRLKPALEPVVKLRDRQIVEVKPEVITAVTLKRFDGVTYDFKKFTTAIDPSGKPQWQMVGADKFERDGLDQLLKHLSTLRAETWLAETGELGTQVVELTLATAQGQTRVIKLDLESKQAKIAGGDAVFAASEQTKLFFDAEYRPRMVLDLAPGEVAQVTVTQGKAKPWTIGKDEAGRYGVLGADGKPLTTATVNAAVAARMFDALTPLRAWRQVTKPQSPGDPSTTLEAVTRGAKKHTIFVGYKDNPALANMNDQWFIVTPDTLGRLNAEPIKKDERAK